MVMAENAGVVVSRSLLRRAIQLSSKGKVICFIVAIC